jgi:hypothetical protein
MMMMAADVSVVSKPWSVQARMEHWVMGKDFDDVLELKPNEDNSNELTAVSCTFCASLMGY